MRTKKIVAIGVAVLLVCGMKADAYAADNTAPKSAAFGFKGVALGTSIDEFRKLPHPDAENAQADAGTKSSVVICTGEVVTATHNYSSELAQLMIFDEAEKDLGVKKCIWVDTHGKHGIAGTSAPLSLAGSGYAVYDYSFSFMPDPRDGVLRFFSFQGKSNRDAFDDVVEALTAKYGRPRLSQDTVLNGIGNSFNRETAEWMNGTSSIVTSDRWGEVYRMGIVVSDKRLSDILQKAKAARKVDMKNPI